MTYGRVRRCFWVATTMASIAIGPTFVPGQAFAAEAPETFMSKVNQDKDKTLSLPEVTAYALKRFAALDVDHDGTLTDAELHGRLSPEDFATADTKHGTGTRTLSKAEFTTYVATLFAAANTHVKTGQTDVDGTLSVGELGTPAGLKLIKLLE